MLDEVPVPGLQEPQRRVQKPTAGCNVAVTDSSSRLLCCVNKWMKPFAFLNLNKIGNGLR